MFFFKNSLYTNLLSSLKQKHETARETRILLVDFETRDLAKFFLHS